MKQFDFKTRHWASFLMLMVAMLFGSVNAFAQSDPIYGVICASTKTMYVTRSATPIIAGDTYNGMYVNEVLEEKWIMDSQNWDCSKYKSGGLKGYPAWYQNTNVKYIQFDDVIAPPSIQCWFAYLEDVYNLGNLDTSQTTNMQSAFMLFKKAGHLDLRSFDTSKVTTMFNMFYQTNLTSIDLSSFDTSEVTNMNQMFYNCKGLTSLDLHNFTNEKVTNMSTMLSGCSNLETLNLTGFGTPSVTTFQQMFSNCSKLETPDFSTFNTSNAINMSAMFAGCSKFDKPDFSTFNTSKVTAMNAMFSMCTGLTELDLHTFDTGKVTNFYYMFNGCSNLRHIISDNDWFRTNIPTTGNNRKLVFQGCTSLRGEHGTTFDSSEIDISRANSGENGYFTLSSVDNAANGHEGYYWSTYYNSNVSSLADDNTDVFIAEVNEEDMTLVMHQVNDKIINAGQAVILRSLDSNINLQRNYASLAGSTATVYDDYTNVLKGKDKTVAVPTDEGMILTLGRIDGNLGFYKYVGANLNAHKAYLARPVASEAGYRFVFDDETPTGISQIQTTMPTNEDKVYDISGRRVQGNLLKGLYIVNGKKVFVK